MRRTIPARRPFNLDELRLIGGKKFGINVVLGTHPDWRGTRHRGGIPV
jgi:hypothetical protein